MKASRNFWLIVITAFAVLAARADDSAAAKKDQAQLQGEWTMVSGERDGQPFPADFTQGSRRVARGDETTVTLQGQIFMKAKVAIDPSKSPKAIDYAVTAGKYAGKTQLGIYELEGDKVKYCFAIPGRERPARFRHQVQRWTHLVRLAA